VLYEPPVLFTQRMSKLDQLTGCRLGWNVVTGYLDSTEKANGNAAQPSHDERYGRADDYMDVVYKLWEQSWKQDPVRQDRQCRIYSHPASVHSIDHSEPYSGLSAPHLCAPSPQRTPVLYQAGASDRGRFFAARHIECVFVMGLSKEALSGVVRALREALPAEGRAPYSIRILAGINVIVSETVAAARDTFDEYRRYASPEADLAPLPL